MSSTSLTDDATIRIPRAEVTQFEPTFEPANNLDTRTPQGEINDWAELAELAKRYAAETGWICAAPLEDPFHLPKIKLYRPPHIAPRIAAQQGIFTVHSEPATNANFPKLELWHIPRKPICFSIKRTLDVCGVNRAALFPDIDGLATYLEWRYKWSDFIKMPKP